MTTVHRSCAKLTFLNGGDNNKGINRTTARRSLGRNPTASRYNQVPKKPEATVTIVASLHRLPADLRQGSTRARGRCRRFVPDVNRRVRVTLEFTTSSLLHFDFGWSERLHRLARLPFLSRFAALEVLPAAHPSFATFLTRKQNALKSARAISGLRRQMTSQGNSIYGFGEGNWRQAEV